MPLFSLQTILSLIQRRTGYTVRGWSDCSWALDQKASTADVRLSADSPDPHRQGVAERLEKVRRDATLAFEQKQLTEAEHAADDFPVILSPSPTVRHKLLPCTYRHSLITARCCIELVLKCLW